MSSAALADAWSAAETRSPIDVSSNTLDVALDTACSNTPVDSVGESDDVFPLEGDIGGGLVCASLLAGQHAGAVLCFLAGSCPAPANNSAMSASESSSSRCFVLAPPKKLASVGLCHAIDFSTASKSPAQWRNVSVTYTRGLQSGSCEHEVGRCEHEVADPAGVSTEIARQRERLTSRQAALAI